MDSRDFHAPEIPAWACPTSFDGERLQQQVLAMYERVAQQPAGGFHFHLGAAYAVQRLGYGAAAMAGPTGRAIGVDISPAMREAAAAAEAGLADRVRILAGRTEAVKTIIDPSLAPA